MNLKFFKSTYARFIFVYLVIFCLSVALLGFATSAISLSHFESHIEKKMNQEVNQLLVDYNQDGLNELRHDMGERVQLNQSGRFLYSLILADGTREFDQFHLPDISAGWHTTPKPKEMRIVIVNLRDEAKLILASNLDDIQLLEKALSTALLITTLLTILFGITGGVLLSKHYFRKINSIRDTAIQIGQGNLHLRLKVENREDIADQIAEIINNMVTRIELLLAESQRVASHIAHEMRTPIGHIRQRVEEIAKQSSNGDLVKSEAQHILQDIDRTLETFSGILRLSEINSGMRKVNFKEFNLGLTVCEICEIYEPVVAENHQHLEWEKVDHMINGDQTLMRQLLVNAIENFLQHTPAGTTLKIGFQKAGGVTYLMLKDNGPGIADIDYFSRPFTKQNYTGGRSGFGLGLSLIQAIAKLHDFEIELRNEGGLRISIRIA